MPRIKRWFPVSHDINSDPEMIELTDKFGLSGLKVWLEILSISDRNEGEFGTDWQAINRSLSIKCNTTQRQVSGILELIKSRLWIASDLPARVLKYSKYHTTRETNSVPSEPSEPSEPSKPLKRKNKNQGEEVVFEVPDWLAKENWTAFVEFRKRIRKPLTVRAMSLAVSALQKLKQEGNDPIAVIDQSILNNWTGLYPTKNGDSRNGKLVEPKGFDSVRGFLALHNK